MCEDRYEHVERLRQDGIAVLNEWRGASRSEGEMPDQVFARILALFSLWKAADRDLDEFEGEG